MNHEERELLMNDYVDGLLDTESRVDFERQMAMDPDLAEEVALLRRLLQQAATAPASIEPPRDLWQGIEARVAGKGARGSVVNFPAHKRSFWGGLSGLAAAAAVATVAGVAYWNQAQPTVESPVAVVAEQAPPEVIEPAAAEGESLVHEWKMAQEKADAAYRDAREGLMDALAQRGESLSPETEAALRDTMAVIDNAVNEITLALADDPQNPALLRMLVATREKELNLLEKIASGPMGL